MLVHCECVVGFSKWQSRILALEPLAEILFRHTSLYSIYEHRLESQILKYMLPNHIAIILDGNRRWAKYNLMGIVDGHFTGADKLKNF